MKPPEEYIAPWVKEAEPYSDKHLEYAWQHKEVLRMMSNENPLPPSERVLRAMREASSRSNLYPHSGYELRKRVAEPWGLGPENVILGNGSTEIIDIILRTFLTPGDEVIISVPTFAMYERRTRVNGGKPALVAMTEDYQLDVERILSAISALTKLIFICSPNNPTGNRIPDGDVKTVLATGVPTAIDEAYYELEVDGRSMAPLIKEYPNAIVTRTLSKAYGLAGLRVGYAFANPSLITYLSRVKMPWNVSLIALEAGLAAIEDEADLARKKEIIIAGRDYLRSELNKIEGLHAFSSEGNFVLIDATDTGYSSEEIVQGILEQGIFVRPMSPHGLRRGFVRVTVGTPEQNTRCVEAFRRFFSHGKAKT